MNCVVVWAGCSWPQWTVIGRHVGVWDMGEDEGVGFCQGCNDVLRVDFCCELRDICSFC